jgi:hypothetical protein
VEAVADHRERVEEGGDGEIEEVGVAELVLAVQAADELDGEPRPVDLVAELVRLRVDADLRPARAEDVVDDRVGDLRARGVEVEPSPDERAPAQNSSSLVAASTTRSTEGMYASSSCQYG